MGEWAAPSLLWLLWVTVSKVLAGTQQLLCLLLAQTRPLYRPRVSREGLPLHGLLALRALDQANNQAVA